MSQPLSYSVSAGFQKNNPSIRYSLAGVVKGLMEAIVLAMVAFSPWASGCVDPYFDSCLFSALGVLLLLLTFFVFLVVRSTLGGSAALLRLSGLAFLNGTALAFFAILQFLSSSPNQIYWSIPIPGMGFGPFICRNHFPFYVNICLGLSVGLLLWFR